jgi:lysophospholipid acyltransferase (LPLAT)-like uncharacterized protein
MSKDITKWVLVKAMTGYIDFVYKTSRVKIIGRDDLLRDPNGEKMVALFWHGDSFCLYPALKGLNLYIVVTKDRRGDYISEVCKYYGYHAMRIPDASDGGNHLFQIRKTVSGQVPVNIAITIDGPIGTYHVPKDFALVIALLTRRKVLPISAEVKRSIRLTRRWDKFKIPLPFNEITIRFNEPLTIYRDSGEDPLLSSKNEIVEIMERKWPSKE